MTNKLKKPIFIIGCPRSGTTVLARILNNHSQVASATETHFFNHLSTQKNYDWTNLDENFLKDFFNETRVEDFCSLLKIDFEEFLAKFTQTQTDTSLNKEDQNQKRVFSTLMLILLERKNKERACEKTPQHLLSIEKILRIYPDAKIIHLIRDGRDTVNSLIKMPWRPEGLLNNSRFWKRYARLGLEINQNYKNQKENFLSVRYENLLLNPETSFQEICNFIELDFETEMLSNKAQEKKNGIFSSWESSWKHKAMEELDSTRVGAWKKELSDKDKTLINWHLEKELTLLGYDPGEHKLSTEDKINILSEYSSLFARKLTRSITNIIS